MSSVRVSTQILAISAGKARDVKTAGNDNFVLLVGFCAQILPISKDEAGVNKTAIVENSTREIRASECALRPLSRSCTQ